MKTSNTNDEDEKTRGRTIAVRKIRRRSISGSRRDAKDETEKEEEARPELYADTRTQAESEAPAIDLGVEQRLGGPLDAAEAGTGGRAGFGMIGFGASAMRCFGITGFGGVEGFASSLAFATMAACLKEAGMGAFLAGC